MSRTPQFADPRPRVADGAVVGVRCDSCGATSAHADRACRSCGSATVPASFGPAGTVWASCVVHLDVADIAAPFTLAYVDLDGGPRVLAHVRADESLTIGTTVVVTGTDHDGNLVVAPRSDG